MASLAPLIDADSAFLLHLALHQHRFSATGACLLNLAVAEGLAHRTARRSAAERCSQARKHIPPLPPDKPEGLGQQWPCKPGRSCSSLCSQADHLLFAFDVLLQHGYLLATASAASVAVCKATHATPGLLTPCRSVAHEALSCQTCAQPCGTYWKLFSRCTGIIPMSPCTLSTCSLDNKQSIVQDTHTSCERHCS